MDCRVNDSRKTTKSPARNVRHGPEMHREIIGVVTALFERMRRPFLEAQRDARMIALAISEKHGGLSVYFSNTDSTHEILKAKRLERIRELPPILADLTQSVFERFLEMGKEDERASDDAFKAIAEICNYYGGRVFYAPFCERLKIAIRNEDIAARYTAGSSPNAIAREEKTTVQTVYRILKERGVALRGRSRSNDID